MRILFIFAFMATCFSTLTLASAVPEAKSQLSEILDFVQKNNIDQERQWRKLVHYENAWFGDKESLIAAPIFFVSKTGKTDPKSELQTFISELLAEDSSIPEEDSLQCRFPARYTYLKDRLASLRFSWPDRPCPKFERWFEALRGTSVALVFSSYYLNNPSSTFGHTLLRINKAPSAKDGRRYELLDYGVNYAANADKANALVYAVKGLFGGFPGTFTTMPYYYKVREYSNAESRDLWEYDLNISPKSVDMLVKHVWEVGPTYANYWYLTENCSYHMLTLLEVADPSLDLTTPLKKWIVPTDTVHVVWDTPGLVKNVHFRPSVRSELFERAKSLSADEKTWIADTVKELKFKDGFDSWSVDRRRLVLDASIDDMDYSYPTNVQIPATKEAKFKNQLLAARAAITQISEPLVVEVPKEQSPHEGHGSRRWGTGYFSDSTIGTGYNFHYKFAFHDMMDPSDGFPESAKISFFDMNFYYLQAMPKFDLNQFSLFEVITMTPYSFFSKSISWRLNIGMESLVNPSCTGCRAFEITGGPGYTFNILQNLKTDFYAGLKFGIYYSADSIGLISDGTLPRWLPGAGPNFSLKTVWSHQLTSFIEGWYRKDYQVSYQEYKELSLAAQWSPSNSWGLRVSGINRWFENAESIDLYLYY